MEEQQERRNHKGRGIISSHTEEQASKQAGRQAGRQASKQEGIQGFHSDLGKCVNSTKATVAQPASQPVPATPPKARRQTPDSPASSIPFSLTHTCPSAKDPHTYTSLLHLPDSQQLSTRPYTIDTNPRSTAQASHSSLSLHRALLDLSLLPSHTAQRHAITPSSQSYDARTIAQTPKQADKLSHLYLFIRYCSGQPRWCKDPCHSQHTTVLDTRPTVASKSPSHSTEATKATTSLPLARSWGRVAGNGGVVEIEPRDGAPHTYTIDPHESASLQHLSRGELEQTVVSDELPEYSRT
ncbi:hypothetical protein O3P69_003269 [Scylla paramamosain]|uniref:Uncharacterized protein n=1 Tax=Scylla paramamosain TaxID=85552 RepID=A0AAW0UK15_SCYPA